MVQCDTSAISSPEFRSEIAKVFPEKASWLRPAFNGDRKDTHDAFYARSHKIRIFYDARDTDLYDPP